MLQTGKAAERLTKSIKRKTRMMKSIFVLVVVIGVFVSTSTVAIAEIKTFTKEYTYEASAALYP
jgi:hypothetical protein